MTMMTQQLETAVSQLRKLSEQEQNVFAGAIAAMLRSDGEEEKEWDLLVSSDASQRKLEQMALQAEFDISLGEVLPYDPSGK